MYSNKTKNRLIKEAVRLALYAGLATATVAPIAYAQQNGSDVEEVVVTGSRIKTDGFESASPVSVSTSLDIQASGISKIEDFLNSLPQLEAGDNSFISNGASGNATLDLRGLGANRTLVLVNGRRLPPGGAYNSAAADVNQIPTAMIKRIDVLTGGASSVYGADAVAGVVNIILRDDFDGVEVSVGKSGYQHKNRNKYIQGLMDKKGFDYPTGSSGLDGKADTMDIIMGGKFAEDRGHATAYVTWRKGQELRQSARDYSSCALNKSGTACGGSGNAVIPNFYLSKIVNGALDWDTYQYLTLDKNSNFIPSVGNVYNYAPVNFFMRPDEKWTFGSNIKFDINDNLKAYSELSFMDYKTGAQIAESGTFFAEEYHLNYDSPILNNSQRQFLTDNWGLGTGDQFAVYIGKRNVEGGPRIDNLSSNSHRIVLGLEGSINENWDFDANYQKSGVNFSSIYKNDFYAPAVADAIKNGEYSVFTYQGVTPEQAKNITASGILDAQISQDILSAYVTGDTGVSIGDNENINLVAGLEHRSIDFARDADTVYEKGQMLGQGGPTPSISGSYNVLDIFLEAEIPLMENLNAELGFRNSDYSTSGRTNTYKVALGWQPTETLRARTSFNRAIRSPSVIELFTPANLGLWSGADSCAGSTPTYTQEQCARTGVTAAQYGNIVASPASQYNGIFGGNEDLKPETADTFTFGVVVDPVENLTFSVDYFNINITDSISSVGAQETLKQCAENNNQQFCDLIHRSSAGSLWLGQTGYIKANSQNLSEETLRGVDIAAAYKIEVPGGDVSFKFTGSKLLKKETLLLPGDESTRYDCAGHINSNCFASPTWRHTLGATYFRNDWSLGAKWRYYGGVSYNDESKVDTLVADGIGAQSYLDVNANYSVSDSIEISGTIQNLTDKEPPMVGSTLSSNANTVAGFYDTLGRYISINATFKF